MSLYRKYRPQKFSEIIGQEHIVQTLCGAIESDQIGHAYVFSGTRGTGKTTIARIFAKAVNCQNRKGAEPCGECRVCKEMSGGTFLDLIEIDAASNRGIDDIRDLREKIRFSPNIGKYKIYIIDEVHMLTTDAFNALLKTLEEPPAHAIFILATTEIHKIPATILSRCQRFDFRKIESEKMFEGIKKVAEKENIKVSEEDLRKIVGLSEGSLRDALSSLDQLNSFSAGIISSDILESVLGYSKEEQLIEILELIQEENIGGVISFISDLMNDGKDMESFLKNLVVFLRKLMILKVDDKFKADFSDSERVKKVSDNFSFEKIVALADTLNNVIKNSKFSFLPQLVFELEIIKFISLTPKTELLLKNENINIAGKIVKEIKDVLKTGSKQEDEKTMGPAQSFLNDSEGMISDKEIKKSSSTDNWSLFLDKVKKEKIVLHMALQGCDHDETNEVVNVKIYNGFYFNRLNEKQNIDFINNLFKEFFGAEKKINIQKCEKEITRTDMVSEALKVFGGELVE